MSGAARAVLEQVERTASPYVFPGRDGGQRKDFKRIPQRVRDKAGLSKEEFRPLHGLRHTFTSWMASTGAVDICTLQKLLTHGSAQMTQRYAHLADETLQRTAAVAGDIFKDVSGAGSETTVLPFRKREQAQTPCLTYPDTGRMPAAGGVPAHMLICSRNDANFPPLDSVVN